MASVIVPAAGPQPAELLVVGERPGAHEAAHKPPMPFVGPSGRDLARYMAHAGLSLAAARRTNVAWDYAPGNADPDAAALARWTPHVEREVARTKPRVVVAVGRYAAAWFLGTRMPPMHVVHGLPHEAGAYDAARAGRAHGACVVPMLHPAFGMRNNEARALIADDARQVARVLGAVRAGGAVDYRRDEHAGHEDYREVTGHELSDMVRAARPDAIALDTEGDERAPWSLQVAWKPGTGYVLRAAAHDVATGVAALQAAFDAGALLVGHNVVMYDYAVARAMGLELRRVARGHVWDNMYALYLMRLEPLGQKPAALRWCGMHGASWRDVIGQASEARQLEYLYDVAARAWPRVSARIVESNDGTVRDYRPRNIGKSAEAIVKAHLLAAHDEDDSDDAAFSADIEEASSTGLWQAWRKQDREQRAVVEAACGPMPAPTLDDVARDTAIQYAGRDPDMALRVYHKLAPEIAARGLQAVMEDGMRVLPVFEEMQATGMPASRRALTALADHMSDGMRTLGTSISVRWRNGAPFNPKSTPQCNALFRAYGIRGAKLTKTGAMSTGKGSIEHLRYAGGTTGEIVDAVLAWREMQHIRDTYCVAVLESADAEAERELRRKWQSERVAARLESRDVSFASVFFSQPDTVTVRPRLKVTGTTTRRLAAKEPNLLAFPKHDKPGGRDYGKMIRDCFVAPHGQVFVECDLSQIESRWLAHESGDPLLCKLFAEGRNIHTETASRLFGVPPDQVTKTQYTFAKRINFGIPYGVSEHGLETQLRVMGITGWDAKACLSYKNEWHALYKVATSYMNGVERDTARTGEVRDCWGMPRYLPAVWSGVRKLEAEARRQAVNHKIQGGAQGWLQHALAWMAPHIAEMQRAGRQVWWTLTVHDSVMFRVAEADADAVEQVALEALREHGGRDSGGPMGVAIEAEAKRAQRWGDL